ncbi:MAG: hypothetical protein HY812_13820 [Planctomycetes bacterium]|nr:hypothetical protein [Planctomycetota bacterium]
MRAAVIFLLLFLCPAASAQVVFAKPLDERVEKRYSKFLTTYQGMQVIIGEPKLGIVCSPGSIQKTGGPEAKNELWVADPSDPALVPYEWEDGKKVQNGKRSVCCFAGDEFGNLRYVDQLQTLEGLALEYLQRLAEIEALKTDRDACDKGGTGWFASHGKMIARSDRLATWLINMGYPIAAKKLKATLEREKKAVAEEATQLREKAALSSVRAIDTPPRLAEISKEITEGKTSFHARESKHVRIIYVTELADSQAERALELAEEIIEAFRKDFVDPYRDEEFHDHIPDRLFAEFFFCPPDDHSFELFKVQYYGVGWGSGKNRERELKMSGSSLRGGGAKGAEYTSYWRLGEQHDVEGIIAHKMGHILANLHYGRGSYNMNQDWLEEAVAYYVSFGHLGRNTVTCFRWTEPSYAKPAAQEGEKTVQRGMRGYFNELALSKGPNIDALAVKTLADITDADFAKAWSFFDFIAMKMGRAGQLWLRRTCLAASGGRGSDFMRRWRAFSEELFPVEPGVDVFHEMDEKWKQYAQKEQARDG